MGAQSTRRPALQRSPHSSRLCNLSKVRCIPFFVESHQRILLQRSGRPAMAQYKKSQPPSSSLECAENADARDKTIWG